MHYFGLAYFVVGDRGLGVEMHLNAFCNSIISYHLPSFDFAAMLFPGAIFKTEGAFGIIWECTFSLQRGVSAAKIS